jgi:hypothetical protein
MRLIILFLLTLIPFYRCTICCIKDQNQQSATVKDNASNKYHDNVIEIDSTIKFKSSTIRIISKKIISNDFLNSDSINKKNYTPNKIEICLLEGDNKINTVIITRNNFIGNPPVEEFKLYDIGNNSIDSIDLLKEEIIFKTFVGEP